MKINYQFMSIVKDIIKLNENINMDIRMLCIEAIRCTP